MPRPDSNAAPSAANSVVAGVCGGSSLAADCRSLFFFFSSRRRHTRFDCDWSSDVCSSDLSLSPLQALAQALDQVKIMYGFPAGSSGDSVARRVAERLGGTPYSKGPGFVENKPGAGGRIAVEALKNASPNGSVLALAPVSAFSVYPHIYPKLTYKPEDAIPVSIGAVIYHGLAVGPAVPAEVKTLKDFLAWAKRSEERRVGKEC